MSESDQYKAANERYEACLHAAGYVETDPAVGVILKDGTIHKPEIGDSFEYSGAYLEYRIDTERCQNESGLYAVRESFGAADPTPNPNLVRSSNQNNTRQMACLATKGWEIPEPVMLRGFLLWDIQFETEDERLAFYGDQVACNMELFGSPGIAN